MTQADHRGCAVEAWVETHRQTLALSTGWSMGEKDVTDDRLARVVEALGKQPEACRQIEWKMGQHLIRVYEGPTEVGRADTSSFSVHHQHIESEAESRLRHGHSQDKRPDGLQYRQLLATIDPAGIPLVSATGAGNGADDPLYYPTWQRMASVLGHKQFVFLADGKAAAIATRAQIAANGGIDCFPVPMSGHNPRGLKQSVLDPPTTSVEIRVPRQLAEAPAVGKGFEVELGKFWLNPTTQKWVRWQEQYLVVYSTQLATAQTRGLHQRLDLAQTALNQLVAKPGNVLESLNTKVEAMLKRHRVQEFFAVTTMSQIVTQTRYLGRGRPAA